MCIGFYPYIGLQLSFNSLFLYLYKFMEKTRFPFKSLDFEKYGFIFKIEIIYPKNKFTCL